MAGVYNFITRKILVAIATRLASKFVEGIDLESFNSSLFNGEVSLRDIKLKQLALDKISLPILVQEVAISKIDIKIPITNILTTAWSVKIDGLSIKVKPRETGKSFPETAERAKQMRDKSIDSCADAFKLKQKLNETFSGRLGIRDKIMRNVFIDISGITLLFSHHITETAPPLLLSISSFHLSTVDSISADTPIHSSDLFFRKRCIIKNINLDITGEDQHALSLSHIDAILNIKINPFELDLDLQLGHLMSNISSRHLIPPKCNAPSRQCGVCEVCQKDVCLTTSIRRSVLRLRSTVHCGRPSKVQLIDAKKTYIRRMWRYCAISSKHNRLIKYLKPTRGSLDTEKKRWYILMWNYATRCTIGASQRIGSRFSNWGHESYKLLEAKQKVLNEYYQLKLKHYKRWRLSKVETRLLAEYEYHLPIPTLYETWDSVLAEGGNNLIPSLFSIPILPTLQTTKKTGRIVGRIFSIKLKTTDIHINIDQLMFAKIATCAISSHYCSGTPYVKSGLIDVTIPDVNGNTVRITIEPNSVSCWVNGKVESPSTNMITINDDGRIILGSRVIDLPWDVRPTVLGKLKQLCSGKSIKHNLPESSGGIKLHVTGFEFSVPRRRASGTTKVIHVRKNCVIKYNRETRQKKLTINDMAPRTVQQVAIEVDDARCTIDNEDIIWFMQQILPVRPPKDIVKPWKTKCIAGSMCEPFTAAYLPLDNIDIIITGVPNEIISSVPLEGVYTPTELQINGHRTWKHQLKKTMICTTTSGNWAVTSSDVDENVVYMLSCSFHGGVHPTLYKGGWMFFDAEENEWETRMTIQFLQVKSYWNQTQPTAGYEMSVCCDDIIMDEQSLIGLQTARNEQDVLSTSSDRFQTQKSDLSITHQDPEDHEFKEISSVMSSPLLSPSNSLHQSRASFLETSVSGSATQVVCESHSPPVRVSLNELSHKLLSVPDSVEFKNRTGDNITIRYCHKTSKLEITINGISIIHLRTGINKSSEVLIARVDVSGNPKVEFLGKIPSKMKLNSTRLVTIPMGRIAIPLENLPHTLAVLKNICELSNIVHNVPETIQVAGTHLLSDPNGMCCSDNGNIYIADTSNHRIMKWIPGTSSGSLVAGGQGVGSEQNQLRNPLGVHIFGNDIFIADSDNHRIQRIHSLKNYDSDGTTDGSYSLTTTTVAGGNGSGDSPDKLSFPRQVMIGPDNCLYICDTGNNRIQRWEIGSSEATTVAGDPSGLAGSTLSLLDNPTGIFISRDVCDSCLFVADTNNHRIIRFLLGSVRGVVVAGQTNITGYRSHLLSSPKGVAVQTDGSIFVADSGNKRIQCFLSNLQEGKGQTIWSGDTPPRAISLGRDTKIFFSAGSTVFEATPHNEVACITQSSWVELSPYYPSGFNFGGEERQTIHDCYSQCSVRDDWLGKTVDETLLYDIILTALSTKAQAHRRLILLATEQQSLRYVNYEDGIWGTGFDGRGRNIYGKVLAKVRSHVSSPPASIGIKISNLHSEIPLRRTSTESQKWTAIFEASEVCIPGAGIDSPVSSLKQNDKTLGHVIPIELFVSNAEFSFQRQTTFGYPLEVSDLISGHDPSSFSILQSIGDIALGRVSPILSKADLHTRILISTNHQLPTVPWFSFHCGLYSHGGDDVPPIVNISPKSGVLLGYFQKELIEIVSNPMLRGINEDRRSTNARVLEFKGWESTLPRVIQHGVTDNRIKWYPSRVVITSEEYSMSERWVMKLFRENITSSVWPCCNSNADHAFDPSAIIVLREGLSISDEPRQMDLPVLDDVPYLSNVLYLLQSYASPMPYDNFQDAPAVLVTAAEARELRKSLLLKNISSAGVSAILGILATPITPADPQNAHRMSLELHKYLTPLHQSFYAITWTMRGGSTGLSTVLKVGDEVLVRNNEKEDWLRGTITELHDNNRHIVTTMDSQTTIPPSLVKSEETLVKKKWNITEKFHKLRLGEIVTVRNHLDEPWQRGTVVGLPDAEGSNNYNVTLLPAATDGHGQSNVSGSPNRKRMFKFAKLQVDEYLELHDTPIETWYKDRTLLPGESDVGIETFKFVKRHSKIALQSKVLVRDKPTDSWLTGTVISDVGGYHVDVGGVQKIWRQLETPPPNYKSGDAVLVRNAEDQSWIRALFISSNTNSYTVQQQGTSTQTNFTLIHPDEKLITDEDVKVRNNTHEDWHIAKYKGINPTTGLFKAEIINKVTPKNTDKKILPAVRCRNSSDMPWEYGVLMADENNGKYRKGFRVLTEENRLSNYQKIQRILLKEGKRVKARNNSTEQWIHGRLGATPGTLSKQGLVSHKLNTGDKIMIRVRVSGSQVRRWAKAHMTSKDNVAEIRIRGQDIQYFHIEPGNYIRVSTADTELGGNFEEWIVGTADTTPNTVLLDSNISNDITADDTSESPESGTVSPNKSVVYNQVIPDLSIQPGDAVFVRRGFDEQWIPAVLSDIIHPQGENLMYAADLHQSLESIPESEVFNYIEKDISLKPGDAVKVRDSHEYSWKYGVVVSSFGGYHVQLTTRKHREAQQLNPATSIELSKAKVWRETERDDQCLRIGDTVRVKDEPNQCWKTGVLTSVRDGEYETETLFRSSERIECTTSRTYNFIERLDCTISCTLKHKSLYEARKLLRTLKLKIAETLHQTNNYGGTSTLHPTTHPASQYLPTKHGLLDTDGYPEGTFHKTHFYIEVPSIEVCVSNSLLQTTAIIQCKQWWWESSQTFYDLLGDTGVESCKVWLRSSEINTSELIGFYKKTRSEVDEMASLLSGSDCQIQRNAQDKPWEFTYLWNKLGDSVATSSYDRSNIFTQPTGFVMLCDIVGSRRSPNRRTPPQYPPMIGWDNFLSTRSKTNAAMLVNEPLAMHLLFIVSWQDRSLFCRSLGKRGMFMSCELGDVQANIENTEVVKILLETATHYYDPRYGIPELLNTLRQPYYEPIPVGDDQVDISDVKISSFLIHSSTVSVHERYLYELHSPGLSILLREAGLASQDAVRECHAKASKMQLSRIDYHQYKLFLLDSPQRSAIDLSIKFIPHTSLSKISEPSVITCYVGTVHVGCYVTDLLYLYSILPSDIVTMYSDYIEDQYAELIEPRLTKKRSWNVPLSSESINAAVVESANSDADVDNNHFVSIPSINPLAVDSHVNMNGIINEITHSVFTDSTLPLETDSSNEVAQTKREMFKESMRPTPITSTHLGTDNLTPRDSQSHVVKRKLFKNKLGVGLELEHRTPSQASAIRSPKQTPVFVKEKTKRSASIPRRSTAGGVQIIVNTGLNPHRLRCEPDDNRLITDCRGVKKIVIYPCNASDQLEYLKLQHKLRRDETTKRQKRSMIHHDDKVLFNVDIAVQGVVIKVPSTTEECDVDDDEDAETVDTLRSILCMKVQEITITGNQLDGRLHPSAVSIEFLDTEADGTVEENIDFVPNLPFEIYYDFQSIGRGRSKPGVQNSILSVGVKIFSSEIRICPATISRLRSVLAALKEALSSQLQPLTYPEGVRPVKKETELTSDGYGGALLTFQVSVVIEQFLSVVLTERQQQLCMASVQNTQISVQMTSKKDTIIEITQPVFKVVTDWSRIPLVVYHAESAGASPLFRYAFNQKPDSQQSPGKEPILHNIYCDIRPVELYAPPSYLRDLLEVLVTPAFHLRSGYQEPVNETISTLGTSKRRKAIIPENEPPQLSFKPLKPTSIDVHMQCSGITILLDVPLAEPDIANMCTTLANRKGVFIKEYRLVVGEDLKLNMNTKGEASFDLKLTKLEYSWQGKIDSQYFGDRKRMIGTGHLLLHAGRELSSSGIYSAALELTGNLLENIEETVWTDIRLTTSDFVDSYKIASQYLNVLSTGTINSATPASSSPLAFQTHSSFLRTTTVSSVPPQDLSESSLGPSWTNLSPSTIKLKFEIPGVRMVLGDDSSKLDIDLFRTMVHTVQFGGVAALPMSLSRLAYDASKLTVHCEGFVDCEIQNYNVKTGLWDLIASCEPRMSVVRLQDLVSNKYELKVSLQIFGRRCQPNTDTDTCTINIPERCTRSINQELQAESDKREAVTVTLNTKALLDTLFVFTNVKRRARATVANTAGAYTPASNNNCRHIEDTSAFSISNESGLDLEIADYDDDELFTTIKGQPYGNKFSLDRYVKRLTVLIGVKKDEKQRHRAVGIRRVHRVYFDHSKLVMDTSVTGSVLSTLARSCVMIKNTLPYFIEVRFSPKPTSSLAVILIPGGATRSVPCPLVTKGTYFDVKPFLNHTDSDSDEVQMKWSIPLKSFTTPSQGKGTITSEIGNPGFPVYIYDLVTSNESGWKQKRESSSELSLPAKCEMVTGEHGHQQVRNFFLSASYIPSWTADEIPQNNIENRISHKDVTIAITPSVRLTNRLPINIRYATRFSQTGSNVLTWIKIEPGATAILHVIPISGDVWLEISMMGDIEMRCQPLPIPKANTKKARTKQEHIRFTSVSKSKKNVDKPTEGSCSLVLKTKQDKMTARAELTLWAPIWFVNKIDPTWSKTVRVERKVRTILSWISSSTCDIREAPNYGMPFGVPVPYTPSNREPKENISIVINDGQHSELVGSGEAGSQTRICKDQHSEGVRFIPISINATIVPSNFGKLSHFITLTDKYVTVNRTGHHLELRIAAPFVVTDSHLSASSITPVLPCQSRVSFESPSVPTEIPFVTPIVWEYSSPSATISADSMPKLQVRLHDSSRWSPAFSCSLLYGRVRVCHFF